MVNASVRYSRFERQATQKLRLGRIAAPVTPGLGTPVQARDVQESPRSAPVLRRAARRYLAAAER